MNGKWREVDDDCDLKKNKQTNKMIIIQKKGYDGLDEQVIQRRGDFGEPRENFSVSWRDYKLGFGSLDRQFWFGNDFIHR